MTKQKKIVKKSRVVKEYNCNTMSKSAFFGMLRSALRNSSRWWKPIVLCKQQAKRPYKGPNKRQKFEYLCASCHLYFPDKNVNVDHIIPAGTLSCFEDLPGFTKRLFVEVDGLQCLCSTCHNNKTKLEKQITLQNKNKLAK